MYKKIIQFLVLALLWTSITGSGVSFAQELQPASKEAAVYVIPIKGQITKAQLYILRRGLKQALQNKVDTVVLKIDTPGGAVDVTLEMMEALENFKGETLTFVNKEAMSAGAFISAATDEIYFHPQGILGAAAAIQATGSEIPETLKKKMESYLRARIRSYTKEFRYRADVVRAMMDTQFELKIGEEVIKEKGELLTLTADEAVKEYGDPPEKLFGAGIVETVKELLDDKFGAGKYQIRDFELTWSESLARWLNAITPVLLGIGMLLLFIEFKTPGFGIFGIAGISFLLIVFASSYVAGLAGYEEVLVFILGLLLVGVEVLIFPGIMIAGVLGGILILGSIVWALADIWPGKEIEFTGEVFTGPLIDLAIGMIIAVAGIIILGRFVLKSWIWDVLVLKSTVGQAPQAEAIATRKSGVELGLPEVGSKGLVVTNLHPTGEIEIKGKRYQGRVRVGVLEKGTEVEVVEHAGFSLIVKPIEK